MKKDILFIIPSLCAGGGEKSLVNLLQQMDYEKYNVDLFLIKKQGLFLDFLPQEVNVLGEIQDLVTFQLPLIVSINEFLKKGKLSLVYHRVLFSIKNRLSTRKSRAEQYSFKNLRPAIGQLKKKYDVAIGYLEKTSNYICVDCVNANKKITWIHTDYNKLEANYLFDQAYFKQVDYIITVSQQCKAILETQFKDIKYKIRVINNIVSPRMIYQMAEEESEIIKKKDEMILISVGRLSEEKGFDLAIKACSILKKNHINVRWYIIGDGKEKEKLEYLIAQKGLENEFILLGAKANPYKYLVKADIYIQPSRFEGKSIAMDEAKILGLPIVATCFSTVKDQINHNEDGIIVDMDENSIAEGISLLIKDTELKNKIYSNLKKLELGTEREIDKLQELIG